MLIHNPGTVRVFHSLRCLVWPPCENTLTVQSHLKTGNSHVNFYMRLVGAFNWPVPIYSRIFLTVDVFYLQFQYKFCLWDPVLSSLSVVKRTNPIRFSTGKRRRRHSSLGNHVTKSSGVSVEFTTFNFIKLGFDRDKEKDMKDIPAGTWRRIDVDATKWHHIDVGATSVRRHVPAGMLISNNNLPVELLIMHHGQDKMDHVLERNGPRFRDVTSHFGIPSVLRGGGRGHLHVIYMLTNILRPSQSRQFFLFSIGGKKVYEPFSLSLSLSLSLTHTQVQPFIFSYLTSNQ